MYDTVDAIDSNVFSKLNVNELICMHDQHIFTQNLKFRSLGSTVFYYRTKHVYSTYTLHNEQ